MKEKLDAIPMKWKMAGAAFIIVVSLLVYSIVQGANNASSLKANAKASAVTRITTVTQRCQLTDDVRGITRLDRNVLLKFVPPKYGQAVIVAPYDKKLAEVKKSYDGCEEQLIKVKQIARASGATEQQVREAAKG